MDITNAKYAGDRPANPGSGAGDNSAFVGGGVGVPVPGLDQIEIGKMTLPMCPSSRNSDTITAFKAHATVIQRAR